MQRIAALPGMWDRTITLGSAGKTFSVTGWKVGWTIGAKELLQAVAMAHQWIPFCVSTPLQSAVAQSLLQAEENNFYPQLVDTFTKKRDTLVQGLADVGLAPIVPSAGYFVLANTTALNQTMQEHDTQDINDEPHDYTVCRFLTEHVGVAPIPPSAFYSNENKHLPAQYARFAFCKQDSAIEEAIDRLHAHKDMMVSQSVVNKIM
jgi:aspartate/methionine/tyrosine aminotransferase